MCNCRFKEVATVQQNECAMSKQEKFKKKILYVLSSAIKIILNGLEIRYYLRYWRVLCVKIILEVLITFHEKTNVVYIKMKIGWYTSSEDKCIIFQKATF